MNIDKRILEKIVKERKKTGIVPPKKVDKPSPWPWCLGTDSFWKGKL